MGSQIMEMPLFKSTTVTMVVGVGLVTNVLLLKNLQGLYMWETS